MKTPLTIITGILLTLSSLTFAEQNSNIAINGRWLTLTEAYTLQQRFGTNIAPGQYLVDENTGCWYNQSTGTSGCISDNNVAYNTTRGGGSYDNHGNWNHYDRNSRWGVGGTGDGCIYTPEWSNC
ncbi:hypothetical protein [Hahella ganghwensis]|uniref:hypothetical protein n=1 Tax=Hahella ganghwensis TaxID=286420 RepID=UPI00037BE2D7|nr:hypothetical protein [Hahella ganghwensis]